MLGQDQRADLVPEGGYEVDDSRYYTGTPSRISPGAENVIVAEAQRLIKQAT